MEKADQPRSDASAGFQITKDLLKPWSPCTSGYKWFLDKFPQGGGYAEVNSALRAEKRYDYSSWLTNHVFASLLEHPEQIAGLVDSEVKQAIDETKGSTESSSGDYSKAASSGDYSTAASSGDYSTAEAKGTMTVAMVAGINGRARAGNQGAFALAWKDGEQMRIAVGIVGEGGIKADTWYRISDAGQLVEASE